MSRLTVAAYDQLSRDIRDRIKELGYVPPVRDLADRFQCSSVTAWRIVKAQGWEARGHRWVRKKKTEKTK